MSPHARASLLLGQQNLLTLALEPLIVQARNLDLSARSYFYLCE